MRRKILPFVKKYWREIAIIFGFLYLQSTVQEAVQNAGYAYDAAADAAYYAERASSYASDASDYASQAADSASYCEYLN